MSDAHAPLADTADSTPASAGRKRPKPGERRVLERFYRVPGTAIEGNGLGLAIADEIARVHRSHLQLASGAGGRGLRVWLNFPL